MLLPVNATATPTGDVRTGSSISINSDYRRLLAQAGTLSKNGQAAQASVSFQRAAHLAAQAQDHRAEAKATLGLSGCYIRLFRYREALESSERALQLALDLKDNTQAGAAAGNVATIYYQLGDYSSASRAADQSVALLESSPKRGYLAMALLIAGDIQAQLRSPSSSRDFQRAISLARTANLPATEAMAQDHLGAELLEAGDLTGSEKALAEARRLFGQIHDDVHLAVTNENLAELEFKKQDYARSLSLIDEVLSVSFPTFIPRYWPLSLKGNILLNSGKEDQALATFSEAVKWADRWRDGVLVGDVTGTLTGVAISSVYQQYVETAADLALKTRNSALSRRAYGVLAASRAWSLRRQLVLVLGREMRLPPRYFELLTSLKSTQALVTLGNSQQLQANNAKLQQIRLELADLENKIGLDKQNSPSADEKDSDKSSLSSIQSSLRKNELLLSFCLGQARSFLWAVTRDQVHLYALPPATQIAAHALAFSRAVQHGSDFKEQGRQLSQDLFAALPAALRARPDWLLTVDGALLNGVPFSALPLPAGNGADPLIAAHTIRFLPSELLLRTVTPQASGRLFVGVADPVYNQADPRRQHTISLLPIARAATSVTLARLVGSDREVRSAAAATKAPEVQILTGTAAKGANLEPLFAKHPEVIHFAVHVVSPERTGSPAGKSDEAALALSLTENNVPELLTKENVAAFRVPGSLVVLSGCASQQGEVLASAGIVGLSRAWLLAGASAVLVTAWPTPDDSGHFFESFYAHFRTSTGSVGQRASTALKQAQLDMRASPGYRSQPSFWSAYSLISKE